MQQHPSIEQLQRALEVAQGENRPEDADRIGRMIAARRLEESENGNRERKGGSR